MGQRREVSVLMPVALLVMALVSTFALLAYRNTLQLLIEERGAEAQRLGRQLTPELSLGRFQDLDQIRLRVPQASSLAIFDEAGQRVAGDGPLEGADELAPQGFLRVLLSPGYRGTVVGTTRFRANDKDYVLRVELPAHILRSREQGLRVLTPLVLTVNGAITLIILLFLRRFLQPFDRMVEHARRLSREAPGASQDDITFLVETFDKAMEAMSENAQGDIFKSLEGTLVRSLESGVLLCDASGAVLGLNDVGARLLDLAMPTMGTALQDALATRPGMLEVMEACIRDGRAVQRQECTIPCGEEERTLGVTVHPLRREDTQIRGFLAIFADLTEVQQKQREKWLSDSLSQLGELTAGAAHELRNSLATLRGYLSLIERDPGGEMMAEYLGEIRHESDHLKRVLEDFLAFARPGSLRPQEVDMVQLVHRVAAAPELGAVDIDIQVAPDSDAGDLMLMTVQGDPQLLERAVRNLLNNAFEAQQDAAQDEPVRLLLSGQANGVELAVEDRGAGLPEGERERIFDPFYSRRSGGVGMGLALTRRIVVLHAGRVDLKNRVGGGARATLWLPRAKTDTFRNNRVDNAAESDLS